MREKAGIRDYDWWLLAIAGAICLLGVVEIYSATHNIRVPGSPVYMKQLYWLGLGVICMLIISRVNYHRVLEQAPVLYLIGIVALAAVLAVGQTRLGAKRWVHLMGESFQVSELFKLIIIIVLARFYSEVRTDKLTLGDFIKIGVLTGLPLLMILKQPDLGTALVLIPVAVVGAYLAGIQWKHAVALLVLAAVLIPVGWHYVLKPYQKERVQTFLRPEDDPKKSGYQILQSEIAVGAGGFWGKGLGRGSQNQGGFVPVRYSDFILAALAEETGFIGVFITLALYTALLLRLVHNAQRAMDRSGMYLVMGVAAILGFHLLVNAAMMIGKMPVTGIPLPLMSYGGSVTLFVFLALGLVMNVRIRRFVN
ncbi:MAG TPA: rod shape-determining protein RodA [Candidatus Limnocylindrales bacterium]|nr:rod shape-determining protein RodA [Candidatus Limnocylindrales bacterium]